ncbi:MAG: hypothetical protein HFJ30_10400 [Clostridia bacterium]|jgi:hypothetical protein|nr:hypothetical protein [Clostridia bacterium]
MANEQNLIPWEQRSKEEHREYSRQGGIRSGEVRRQRKAMKEQMNLLLSLPFNLKDRSGREVKKMLAELGIDEDEIDNQMAMIISLWKTACTANGKNQVAAFQEIRKVVQDENTATDDEKVQIINDLPTDDFLEDEEVDNETS